MDRFEIPEVNQQVLDEMNWEARLVEARARRATKLKQQPDNASKEEKVKRLRTLLDLEAENADLIKESPVGVNPNVRIAEALRNVLNQHGAIHEPVGARQSARGSAQRPSEQKGELGFALDVATRVAKTHVPNPADHLPEATTEPDEELEKAEQYADLIRSWSDVEHSHPDWGPTAAKPADMAEEVVPTVRPNRVGVFVGGTAGLAACIALLAAIFWPEHSPLNTPHVQTEITSTLAIPARPQPSVAAADAFFQISDTSALSSVHILPEPGIEEVPVISQDDTGFAVSAVLNGPQLALSHQLSFQRTELSASTDAGIRVVVPGNLIAEVSLAPSLSISNQNRAEIPHAMQAVASVPPISATQNGTIIIDAPTPFLGSRLTGPVFEMMMVGQAPTNIEQTAPQLHELLRSRVIARLRDN